MKQCVSRAILGVLLAGSTVLGTASVSAYETGDIILRAGAAGVFPTGDSENITPLDPGAKVEVDDTWSLGLTGTYMVTNKLGIGLLAAWPFKHDIDASGTISDLGTVGETRQLPPTLTLQYFFGTRSNVHPYVGAGINYTYFFSEDTEGALSGLELELDDSWGLALEAGVDYELDNNWLISGQLWYIDIDTEATIETIPGSYDVEIDPWVFMLGIGKKF